MEQNFATTRAAGGALALGAATLGIALVIHGAPAPHLADMMTAIAAEPLRWQMAHWLAAVGLALFAIAGILMLTGRARLTENPFTILAWAVLPIGALWTNLTAIAEATAVTRAAIAGDTVAFASWWAISEGLANGFAAVALAVAVIAGSETRAADKATPVWAAGIATLAGCASFIGWALWSWADLGPAGPIWVASSILMCLWLIWFGAGLAGVARGPVIHRRDAPSGA